MYPTPKELFIDLISYATIKCKLYESKASTDEKLIIINDKKYTLNDFETLGKFSQELLQRCEKYNDFILSEISNISNVTEKQLFVQKEYFNLKIISKRIKKDKSTRKFTHGSTYLYDIDANSYSTPEENIKEAFQPHFREMLKYIKISISFLKSTSKILKGKLDLEFPVKVKDLESNTISTLNNPIRFFENLCTTKGFKKFKDDFYPEPDEYGYTPYGRDDTVLYDKVNEVITVEDYDPEGELYKDTYTFAKYLSKALFKESSLSIKLIDEYLANCTNREAVTLYFEIIINKLLYANEVAKTNKTLIKYKLDGEITTPFIKYLYRKYKSFIVMKLPKEFSKIGVDDEFMNSELEETTTSTKDFYDKYDKIRTNLIKEVLAYLVHILYKSKNLIPTDKVYLARFISKNFRDKDYKEINEGTINNLLIDYRSPDKLKLTKEVIESTSILLNDLKEIVKEDKELKKNHPN